MGRFNPVASVLICGVLLLPATTSAENYAFLVAVGDYDAKQLRRLDYARNDIFALAESLQQAGFDEDYIVVMHDDVEALTAADLLSDAAKIRRQFPLLLSNVQPDDTLIVAFAGHGIQFKGEAESYFCARDADLDDPQRTNLIAISEIYDALKECPARRKLLLVDACRNDPQSRLSRTTSPDILESVTQPQLTPPPEGVVALFSCAEGQEAFEHPDLEHGIFFYHVLQALAGEADDGDNALTLDEFLAYTKRRTATYARLELNAAQTPRQKGFFEGEWVLRKIVTTTGPWRDHEYVAYFGTYTHGESKGIYASHFDASTGELRPLALAGETVNPSYLVAHPSGSFLYAVNEIASFNGEETGAISSFSVHWETGELTLMNQASSEGSSPCYLDIDAGGENLLVSNYGGGSVTVLEVDTTGRLGAAMSHLQHSGASVDARRQSRPHPHSVNLDPAGRFAVVTDLGIDQLLVYSFDEGSLTVPAAQSVRLTPGSGPRHLAFHSTGQFAFVVNEITSTITVFGYDPVDGRMNELQTLSSVPPDDSGTSPAEVAVHPSGRFVYCSNRGHDSIAVFGFDPHTGLLTALDWTPTGGRTPRHFVIDPSGKYMLVANQSSDSVVQFLIDVESGAIEPTGRAMHVPSPVCIHLVHKHD